MEDRYSLNTIKSPINEDALLMQQVVGDDYELLLIDILLREAFKN